MNIANGTVAVNGAPATTMEGGAPATPFFVATNCPVVNGSNTYTAIITDPFGRTATNSVSVVAQNRGYGYDLNGNMTNDGKYSYTWDEADRLTEVRTLSGELIMTCTYDGLSRRRERILWQDGVGQTNRYIYDGWLVLEICDGGNNTLETYTHGPDLSSTRGGAGGIGGILSMSYSSPSAPCSMLYALYDGNGNVLVTADTNQTITAAFEYGPFGTTLLAAGDDSDSIRYRFSSKEWDGPVGLYYYGFRFYSPALGRWINRDPIRELGGLNLLGYCANNPINAVDRLGLELDWGQYESSGGGTVCLGPSPANIPGRPVISVPTGCDGGVSAAGTKKDGKEYEQDCAVPCDDGPKKGTQKCLDKLECQKIECTAKGLEGVYYYDWVVVDTVCDDCK